MLLEQTYKVLVDRIDEFFFLLEVPGMKPWLLNRARSYIPVLYYISDLSMKYRSLYVMRWIEIFIIRWKRKISCNTECVVNM
jgi:hypothetical protein